MEDIKNLAKCICQVIGAFFVVIIVIGVIGSLFGLLSPNPNRIVSTEIVEDQSDFRLRYIKEQYNKLPVLPAGANNFVDKGNGWMTFDLEFGGEIKTFLFSRHIGTEINVTLIQIR